MKDQQGYEICARCNRRIDLSADIYCTQCAEIVQRELEAGKKQTKWTGNTWHTFSQAS